MNKAEFEAAWSAMSEGERREVLRDFIHELSADYGLGTPDVEFGPAYDSKGHEGHANYTGKEQGTPPVIVINDSFVLSNGERQIEDPWTCFDSAAHEFAHHGRSELGSSYEWGSGAHMNKDGWPSIEHFAWVETQKVLDEIERGERFPYMTPGDTSAPYVHSNYWEHLAERLEKQGWGGSLPPHFIVDYNEGAFTHNASALHLEAANQQQRTSSGNDGAGLLYQLGSSERAPGQDGMDQHRALQDRQEQERVEQELRQQIERNRPDPN
jgi:hypothetical protein